MMPPQDLTYFRKGFGLKSEVQDELASDYDGRLVDFLRRGQFEELLHEASTWHARAHPMDEGPSWARQTADWTDEHSAPGQASRQRRQASTRTPTTRRKGQAREV